MDPRCLDFRFVVCCALELQKIFQFDVEQAAVWQMWEFDNKNSHSQELAATRVDRVCQDKVVLHTHKQDLY